MRILFVAPRFHTNQLPLVRTLTSHGNEVHFHVQRVGRSEDHALCEPIVIGPGPLSRFVARFVPAGGGSARYRFPAPRAYLRLLRETAPDLMIIKNPSHPFALLAAIAGRILGIRILFYTQGPVYGRRRVVRDAARALLLRAFAASGYSPVAGDPQHPKLHEFFHYLPFIADGEVEPKREWFSEGRIAILSVGKFVPRKNHLLLLEAVERLRSRYPVVLTVVGECVSSEQQEYRERVLEAISRLGLEDVVRLRTNVPFERMSELYRQHDLFVMPSRDEPAGVSHLEAMARGLPVVCSTTNGTSCYVRDGINGRVFRSDDREDLVRSLESIVADRERLVRMGCASLELARTVHDGEAIYRRLLEIARERPGPRGRW